MLMRYYKYNLYVSYIYVFTIETTNETTNETINETIN